MSAGPATRPVLRRLDRLRDWVWLMKRHRRQIGAWPNPWRPRTFNDWIHRRLLLAPEPLHAQLSCKLGQRAYKAPRIGEAASLPLLGVWDDAAGFDRAWDSLPDAFMLKPTHASSWKRAVPDKAAADRAAIVAEAAEWLCRDYYRASREIGYRGLVPRLIAEPLLPAPRGLAAPREYSSFCFDGRVALVMARSVLPDGRKPLAFFDAGRRRLALRKPARPEDPAPAPEAEPWNALCAGARTLSRGVDFLRCDFLLADGRIWASEVTPYPDGGRTHLDPACWLDWLGAVWSATRTGRPWPDPPAS